MPLQIDIAKLTKSFKAFSGGVTHAVDRVDLTIEPGELFFLLGPSGCGKTTLLRMIAGFIEPTAGTIRFDQRDITRTPANKRHTGMVFQSYALWPHMTVRENVAFGLRVRKIGREERDRRAARALEAVQMSEYAERRPAQLSGGQQQRVALARAIVIEPDVLLLDEPLSNLDAKLRNELRVEIRRVCKESGITSIYVTHDQKEALSMADRIAIMRSGKVEQIGAPDQLYHKPNTKFVAEFLGETNILEGECVPSDNSQVELKLPAGRLRLPVSPGAEGAKRVMCSIRPESWVFVDPGRSGGPGASGALAGEIESTTYLGEVVQHQVKVPGAMLKVLELGASPAAARRRPGDAVALSVAPESIAVIDTPKS